MSALYVTSICFVGKCKFASIRNPESPISVRSAARFIAASVNLVDLEVEFESAFVSRPIVGLRVVRFDAAHGSV